MLAKVFSFGLLGIEAYPIEIEVDIAWGLPVITLVGLADTAIRESRERVKAAIKNSGFVWPNERVTISLAPSDIKKEGTSFDLAIALGVLAATGQVNPQDLTRYCLLGELSLDGSLRPTKGILPVSLAMAKFKLKDLIVPLANAKEAALVADTIVWPVKTLRETVEFLNSPQGRQPFKVNLQETFKQNRNYAVDFSEVKAQIFAKRAIEVAVSGRHNILLIGPPGSGKTMLAKRIPTIMPDLTLEEALEITKIHSVATGLAIREGIIATRPFRSPHHSASAAALAGGGSLPQPGEISLAHNGVLFLDEFPEFRRDCLEVLRQPLEDGSISIARASRSLNFPAVFMLVAAMNPCMCGNYFDPQKKCRCTPNKIHNYMGRISGPLLDRIDIHIELPAIRYKELVDTKEAQCSAQIKQRVEKTRLAQLNRLKSEGVLYNSQMNGRLIKKYCWLNNEAKGLLAMAMTELGFSARAYDKILKVSRTIADLAESEEILAEHIAEALQYRSLDKQY